MNKVIVIIFGLSFLLSIPGYAESLHSTCYGTTKKGRLDHGVQLPGSGSNFVSYGNIPELLGRTYVHSTVKNVVIESYAKLEKSRPNTKYKFAETGFAKGGEFKPHKTHQNGLSIDFMVPVINTKSKSVYFSTTALNRYGYDVEFNSSGVGDNYKIDFNALGAHLVALNEASIKNGIKIWRVLFAPDLQNKLYASQYGAYIKKNITIPKKKSWVRHDEHYHVDFKINCLPL